MFYRVRYRDLLLYGVYGFLKWKMIRGNGFRAISCLIFVLPKFGGRIYTNLGVPWMNYLSNQRLAKVASPWVCEITNIMELSALLLVKSCLPPVDTYKYQTNRMADNFPADIYLFKVSNRKTRKRCEALQI